MPSLYLGDLFCGEPRTCLTARFTFTVVLHLRPIQVVALFHICQQFTMGGIIATYSPTQMVQDRDKILSREP
jgi:hypothetical protein